MKALAFNPADDSFAIRDLPVPEPGPGDVLVKVAACGLNPVDAKILRWKSMVPGMDARWTPGLDVSGEIVGVGTGVDGWKVCDRVLYRGDMFRPHGGLAVPVLETIPLGEAAPRLVEIRSRRSVGKSVVLL